MLDPSGNIGAARLCPYLGLASDPSTACLFVSDFHRCFRRSVPEVATEGQQAAYCVSGSYATCPRFATAEQGVVSETREQANRILPGSVRRTPLLILAAAMCVLAIAAFVISSTSPGANQTAGKNTSSAPSSNVLPTGVESSPTTLAPAVAGSAPGTPPTPPAQGITAPGSAPAHPIGTPVASPNQKSYVVVAGDTLWGIAQKHGVTVEALMKANGLTDRTYIRSGQRLVIPER